MPSIRKTPGASGATAVQVVEYKQRKVVVLKHVGTARTPEGIEALIQAAESWMDAHLQSSMFAAITPRMLPVDSCSFAGVRYMVAYRTLRAIAAKCGFSALHSPLSIDLAVMRVFEPCSKRRSLFLLAQYFGIQYSERTLYRVLPAIASHKEEVLAMSVSCAKREFSFDCSLVLYDVTTLYFESFREDEEESALRKTGFSKDQKPQQPQVVVGLLVTSDGFPLGYELFKGNTFEGHTMLPVLEHFCAKHGIAACTVVADAAMLSWKNMEALRAKGISYIVGARVANLSAPRIDEIARLLKREQGSTIRLSTRHGDLVCSYSDARYRKDKHEMDKQITKAKTLIASSEPGRRAKFVHMKETTYVLNDALVKKTKKLLGIKGFITNIPESTMSNQSIIDHYRNLWRVEQAFRMAKSDLEVRPIFHRTEDAIKSHLLICFMALAMTKYIELKTGLSLRSAIDLWKSVGEARIIHRESHQEFTIPASPSDEVREMLSKLGVSY